MRRGAAITLVLASSIALGLAGTACVQTPPFSVPGLPRIGGTEAGPVVTAPAPDITLPSADAAAPGLASSRAMATARLGSLSESLTLTGRISTAEESSVRIQAGGRVEKVHVSLGQTVEAGQLLLELDMRDQAKELTAARSRLDTASLRLAQATQMAEQRVRDAENESRRAQFELAQTRAGAPASERQAAQAALTAAQSALARAEADLERVKAGPTAAELREAEQLVLTARAQYQKAEMDLARLKRGTEATELAAADREVLAAQAAAERAQIDLDRLQRGPDPADLAAAERDVERARLNLRAAQSAPATGSTRAQRDANIASAEASLRDAEARLDRVRQSIKPEEIAMARRNLEIARANLAAAQQRQALLKRGPDQAAVSSASLALDQAKLALESAEQRLRALQAGPTPAQVATASAAVDSARASYIATQARMAEIDRRGTGAEAARAEDRASTAASAVERARAASTTDQEQKNPAALDIILLQKEVRDLQAQVETLERQVTDGSPRAAAIGQVSAIQVRPGDPVEVGQVVISIARPATPVVVVDLTDDQRERLWDGQSAVLRVDGRDSVPGRVAAIAMSGAGNRVARVVMDTPIARAGIGAPVQVGVILMQKDNIVILPKKAIRTAGTRRYVEQMDGLSRRLIDVQVGLTSGDDVEIVTGLMPGESVLLPS